MKKFLKDISIKALKAVLRAFIITYDKMRKIDAGKLAGAISGLGEKLIKFIYRTGLFVENTVIKIALFAYRAVRLFCIFCADTGDDLIHYSVIGVKKITKIIMLIPKSIVRDFSYWAPATCAAVIVVGIISSNFYAVALKVTVNGATAGYVANEDEFSQVVSTVEDKLGDTIGDNYVMSSKPEYSFTVVNKQELKDEQTIYDNVYSIVCEEIGEHYGLYVDGQLIAAADTEATINTILDELKAPYVTGNENESVEFVADVRIKKGIYAPSYFMPEDKIRALFSASTNPRYYTIQEDDYLSDISKATGLSKAQLYALNPELDERKLVPGKKVNISQPDVYLGIKIVKTVTYTEEIDYETIKIQDDSLYKTQTKVKKAGIKGEKEITATITYVDGAKVSEDVISSKVVKEPVTRELYVGTKALPTTSSPLAGTGTFIRPINGGYTSCAYRGYRGHTGVDLAMSSAYGKPVYASASGTVISAGWSGGYGKMIKIRHSNGYETWYAHLSSIDVSTGATVYQGQHIGRIGSTGNSTGPHLHFELRINGKDVNPMKYIG